MKRFSYEELMKRFDGEFIYHGSNENNCLLYHLRKNDVIKRHHNMYVVGCYLEEL